MNPHVKSAFAVALMTAPLLIVALVSYWPSEQPALSPSAVVLLLPVKIRSEEPATKDLAKTIPQTLSAYLRELPGLSAKLPGDLMDFETAGTALDQVADEHGATAVVFATLASDSGFLELDLQVVEPHTHRTIWSNAYQSPRTQYSEMIRVAGKALQRAFQGQRSM